MVSRVGTDPQRRRLLAIGMLAGALLASSHAEAEDAAGRIRTVFDLVRESPTEPAEPFATHAEARRALERNGVVAALPYSGIDPALAAFHPRQAGDLIAGVFGRLTSKEIVLARLPRPRPEVPATIAEPIVTGSIAPSVQVPEATVQEAAYFGRFAGTFAGSGEVRRNARSGANQVDCNLTGQAFANGVSIAGKCGVSFVSREVRADIRYDPATGVYTGTYIGAAVGPAKLWGKRRGDQVVLTITWPELVNGDTKATMTIRNSGDGTLAIVVTDHVQPGGPQAEVTRLALSQM